jgi:glycyl-tRNA synthetase (class II)
MKLSRKISPYTCAILPLMKKAPLAEKAKEVFEGLLLEQKRKDGLIPLCLDYDEAGSIGIVMHLFFLTSSASSFAFPSFSFPSFCAFFSCSFCVVFCFFKSLISPVILSLIPFQGKRYRRQDEIGTPFCVTIDHDTLNDNTVTLRDRDSMKQKRIQINQIRKVIENEWEEAEKKG